MNLDQSPYGGLHWKLTQVPPACAQAPTVLSIQSVERIFLRLTRFGKLGALVKEEPGKLSVVVNGLAYTLLQAQVPFGLIKNY